MDRSYPQATRRTPSENGSQGIIQQGSALTTPRPHPRTTTVDSTTSAPPPSPTIYGNHYPIPHNAHSNALQHTYISHTLISLSPIPSTHLNVYHHSIHDPHHHYELWMIYTYICITQNNGSSNYLQNQLSKVISHTHRMHVHTIYTHHCITPKFTHRIENSDSFNTDSTD